ncbi:hypothetical protein [Pontiella agarivorans]|uniref:Lipoprotein n=1 Tax=Pontiella agarivorans TaxID=3038953 RepID=A0ABU5MXI8_9BACT|nr:hypothetical protein [Pontiella agarivorans]MDZ8118928.1 hypothetical protein [Pontiella agarivorans]
MKINILLSAASILCAGLLCGCASSYHEGELSDISSFPTVRAKKSVYVDLAFSGRVNGEPWPQTDANNQAFLADTLIRSLEESGMFSRISTRDRNTDLQLLVAVINDKTMSSSDATLAALTLFLYPNTETDTFRLLASVKDSATGESHRIQLQDGVIRRQQLLLGLLAPFKPHGAELEKSTDRLMNNLVLDIHKAGLVK